MMRFYGYKHWTLEETSRCFNVGKGLKGRADSDRRNHKWHAIVKRYGLRVEICYGPVTNEEACTWEIDNILKEGTFTINHSHDDPIDIGCNFTKGGEGVSGFHHKPGAPYLIRKGKHNPMFGRRGINNPNFGSRRRGQEITCPCGVHKWVKQSRFNAGKGKFCSKRCYVNFHPNKTDKVRIKLKERSISNEARHNMSCAAKRIGQDPEVKRRRSKAQKERIRKPLTLEQRQKRSEALLNAWKLRKNRSL